MPKPKTSWVISMGAFPFAMFLCLSYVNADEGTSPCLKPDPKKTFQIENMSALDSSKVDPKFRRKALLVLNKMKAKGYPLRIKWAHRTKAQNDKLVAEGKASKNSKHLSGKALDVICNRVGYSYPNDRDFIYYKDLDKAVKQVDGLVWGGDFETRWDPTHFELEE